MSTVLDLALRGAGGEAVDLFRTINSHGFADLPPMRLDESQRVLEATIPVAGARPRRVRIGGGRAGRARVEVLGPPISERLAARVLEGVRHVLRLDADLSVFYAKAADDPDLAWAAAGAGRMLRSPIVFEDVVKTICTTNCSWSLTTRMVTAIVTELGEPAAGGGGPTTNAFPTPAAMASRPERFYREVVRAGYRSPYFAGLAQAVETGAVDLEGLGAATRADLSDDEMERALLGLPGVGPYAAAHVMMTIGRDSRLILDSWSRPTYAKLVGRRSVSDEAIRRRFGRYGDHAGLAFWLFVTRDWVAQD